MNPKFESILSNLDLHGIAVVDGFLDSDLADQLRREALIEYAEGEFRAAKIGKGIEKQHNTEIRGDKINWLQREAATHNQDQYWQTLDELREVLSPFFRIHLERTELHFTVYPKGSFYAAHLDQFEATSNRIFSVILYLNPDWKEGDGGELQYFPEDAEPIKLAPLHNRLIIFRSDMILHEVLETQVQRVSLTGWMRKDKLIF